MIVAMMDANHISERLSSLKNEMSELRVTNALHLNQKGYAALEKSASALRHRRLVAYSGEIDQGSGVMPISVPVDSDQVIGAERRWRGDCVRSDRNRQEEVEEN